MKSKGRRQSKNVEVQTSKQKRNAEYGLKLQDQAYNNDTLKEKTSIRDQGLSEEGKIFAEISNPGNMVPRMIRGNAPAIKDKITKSPAERRGMKDPSPQKFSKGKDLPFFKHNIKGK